jgi:hypothetical protein
MYTCGRMHKPQKRKLGVQSTKAVIDTVYKMMQEELSSAACDRWCSRLNAELGYGYFGAASGGMNEAKAKVPRMWVPSKPKLTLALLDEFVHARATLPKTSIGSNGATISKVLARCVVEDLCKAKGREWLEGCGELSIGQLNDSMRLNHTLSRVAFDLLVYTYARAVELRQQDGGEAVLELHSSDQTVVGREMRGSGIVYCRRGREIFIRAVELVRETMSSAEPQV